MICKLKILFAVLFLDNRQNVYYNAVVFFGVFYTRKKEKNMKIITISREFGSGGREIGKRLADALL